MKPLILISILTLSRIVGLLVAPTESLAALSYTRVKIEAVDTAAPSLTFKTSEGEVWTLTAFPADILKGVQKGDTCSVEIDLENRVTKIVKIDSTAP